VPIHLKTNQVVEALGMAFRARRVPELRGNPGCGKSALVMQFANEAKLLMIDARISQLEPTDLNGYPSKNEDNSRATVLPPDWIPLKGDKIPDGYNGWCLFWDERPDGDDHTKKALYKILHDKKVGQQDIHPAVFQVCAGNLVNSNNYAEEDSDAIKLRIQTLYVMSDLQAFLEHAIPAGIDSRITSYLNWRPQHLNTYEEMKPGQDGCAVERTWTYVDQWIKGNSPCSGTHSDIKYPHMFDIASHPLALPMIAGELGEGVARDWLTYLEVYKDLPSKEEIFLNPTTAIMPEQPGTLYAMTGNIGNWCKGMSNPRPSQQGYDKHLDSVMEYISRMPMDFQVVSVIEMIKRDAPLIDLDPVADWLNKNGSLLAA